MDILIVEDELKVASFLEKGLSENGYNVMVAYDGNTGLRMAKQKRFDIIILDLMLPGLNGFEFGRQLRVSDVITPILILSALSGIEDKIEGFKFGADDYMVKPFHFKELLLRLQAITRRKSTFETLSQTISFGDLVLDQDKKVAIRQGKMITLTAKEYALLQLFISNKNKVLSRKLIAEQVWGYEFDISSNVIDVYVNYLRKKVDGEFNPKLIHTVVGMGYILKEE